MIVLAHSSFAQSAGEVWNFFAQGLRDAIWVRKEEELARLYHISIPSQTDLPISYNIAPSQKVLTIRFNPETRARSMDAPRWGLIPYWVKDPKIAYRTVNARAETPLIKRLLTAERSSSVAA